jgi:hypothetical protein
VSNCDSPYRNHICPFFASQWEYVFLKFRTWLLILSFHHTVAALQWKVTCPCSKQASKKQRPYVSGFPLLLLLLLVCCDHNTLCITVVTEALMERGPLMGWLHRVLIVYNRGMVPTTCTYILVGLALQQIHSH